MSCQLSKIFLFWLLSIYCVVPNNTCTMYICPHHGGNWKSLKGWGWGGVGESEMPALGTINKSLNPSFIHVEEMAKM